MRDENAIEGAPPVSRIERVAESAFAKLLTRIGVPILLTVIGFFLLRMIGTVDRIEDKQGQQGEVIADIKSDVRDVTTRMDERVIRQVDEQGKKLEDIDQRVRALERTTPIP